ncbi:uncharacterized protein ACR2FA_004575 [Aphomia sociella]
MKVKLAAQVFSQRVSSAQDTADFLLIFDKLFDSFNANGYGDEN